jgi:hypothetical protein
VAADVDTLIPAPACQSCICSNQRLQMLHEGRQTLGNPGLRLHLLSCNRYPQPKCKLSQGTLSHGGVSLQEGCDGYVAPGIRIEERHHSTGISVIAWIFLFGASRLGAGAGMGGKVGWLMNGPVPLPNHHVELDSCH